MAATVEYRDAALARLGRDLYVAHITMASEHPDLQHVHDPSGREYLLVGTAHVSRESVDLARASIESERPDCVCLELDAARYQALKDPDQLARLDLREVIRRQQLPALLVNLILSSYQRRLGDTLGVAPGAEMLEGGRCAEAFGIPVVLADRDVRITLRRAWSALSWWRKAPLVSALLGAVFEAPEVSEDDLRDLRRNDAPTLLAEELSRAAPALKRILLDERDLYMAEKLRRAPGRRILALVGAGHVAGVAAALRQGTRHDLAAMEVIQPLSAAWRLIGWSIPAAVVGSIAWIAWTQGIAAAGSNSGDWILITGVPCALGAIAALAHPGTVLAAFVAAPITTLSPVLGAGYVTAFAQVYFKPPLVSEFQSVPHDLAVPKRWWRNRLLQVLLVFVLTSIGASIGTFVGGARLVSSAF